MPNLFCAVDGGSWDPYMALSLHKSNTDATLDAWHLAGIKERDVPFVICLVLQLGLTVLLA